MPWAAGDRGGEIGGVMTKFGLHMSVSSREPIRRVGEIARMAEDLAFDTLWIGDSQLIKKDVYVALTVGALETTKIKIGPGVTQPITRHITATVNAIAGIDDVSNGRALLGVGSGDSAVFPLGAKPASIGGMREMILSLRELLAGREVLLQGHPVRVRTVARPVPIFLAASQPRMLMLAGEIADGVILMGAADADLTRWQLEWIARGAKGAGRDPNSVFVDLWFGISVSDDREKARLDVKAWATSQARWFSHWKELPEPLERFKADFARARGAYDFSEHLSLHAKHKTVVSDEFADFVAVAGPVDQCARRIKELLRLRVDRVTFTLLAGGRMNRLRQLGSEVVPAVSASG